MKKILFICLLLGFTSQINAQEQDNHRERIKALKTAFITEGMSLTAEEAQRFWPVYNEFEEKRRSLYRREHKDIESLECFTEEGAEAKLEEYVEIERQDYLLKKQYFADLKNIFSAKRIIQLMKIEDEFNEKLMREYRSRKSRKK